MNKIIYSTFVFLVLVSFQSALAVTCVTLDNNLYPGARDSSVSTLQSFLQSTGDYTDTQISGYFGLSTQQAVQRFQKRNGIVSSGTPGTTGYGAVGPETRKAINASCANATSQEEAPSAPRATTPSAATSSSAPVSSGDSDAPITRTLTVRSVGADVRTLQEFLKQAGDYTYPEVTGYFGPATQEAVQRFQARTGIVDSGSPQTTGYGLVGPSTRRVLAERMSDETANPNTRSIATRDSTGQSLDILPSSSNTTPSLPSVEPLSYPEFVPGVVLSANPSHIKRGESSTLTWRSEYARSCRGNFADKEGAYISIPTAGSRAVSPFGTFSYRVECTSVSGRTAATVVEVKVQQVLTEAQIQALVALMQSFGITQSLIDDIEAVLRGYSPHSTENVRVSDAYVKNIIGLLESFGADQRTIEVIRGMLTRGTGGGIDPIPERSAQVHLTVSPSAVTAGESVNFTWESDDALVCTQPIKANEKGNIDWNQHLGYAAGQTQGAITIVPYPLSDWQNFNGFARYAWMVGCRGLFYPDEIAIAEVSIEFKKGGSQADLQVTPTSGNAPLAVTFSANLAQIVGTQQGGTIELDFGDGQRGTLCKTYSSGVAACTPSWVGPHTYERGGTYIARLLWQYESGGSSILDTEKIVVNSQNIPQQNLIINGFNVYSPEMVLKEKETLQMYFGGWMNKGQRHDDIYIADCSWDGSSCSNVRTVIDATAKGFNHLNDPSIIRLIDSTNTGRAYYLMYLTGVEEGEDGLVAGNNNIYYSTSWANDGINWSTPRLLLRHHWLPSATVKENGEVELYASDNTIHGGVVRINLGTSGVNVGAIDRVSYGTNGHFANVDVEYDLNEKRYHIVAERMEPQSTIDLFTSTDGINWRLVREKIVTAADGQYRVGTPTFHPSKRDILFFGSTAQSDSMGFKIRRVNTTMPDAPSAFFIEQVRQAFVHAFERGVSSLANSLSAVLMLGR